MVNPLKDATLLERTQVLGSKYRDCMSYSLLLKAISLTLTKLFVRGGWRASLLDGDNWIYHIHAVKFFTCTINGLSSLHVINASLL